MAELLAPLPNATLIGGMSIVLEALDPTTGNPVAGVIVSDLAIYADTDASAGETVATVELSLPEIGPLWAPTPAETV